MVRTIAVVTVVACGLSQSAAAQSVKELAGFYTMTFETRETGKTSTVNTNGALALDASGHYSIMTIAPDLPKIASNNRTTATPEESKAIVGGSVSHYGIFTVSGDKLIFKIERATFPNWNGIEQKRAFTFKGDELTYTVATASGGGSVTLHWKRMK
jgi:hypothetical protein